MNRILLINPNTSQQTTSMMHRLASAGLPDGNVIIPLTAPRGEAMIVNETQLKASVEIVVEMGRANAADVDAIIVSAFGDPGVELLRDSVNIPVLGICEASMIEAAAGKRRFGIATVTPDLARAFSRKASSLQLGDLFVGTRLTEGDPVELSSDAGRLRAALLDAARDCFEIDRAEAVIVGGGPLSDAAVYLAGKFHMPIIAPISAAVRQVLQMLP